MYVPVDGLDTFLCHCYECHYRWCVVVVCYMQGNMYTLYTIHKTHICNASQCFSMCCVYINVQIKLCLSLPQIAVVCNIDTYE